MQIGLCAVDVDVGDDTAGRDDVLAGTKVEGTPTASIAVSTPRPAVRAKIFSTASPSLLLMAWVAPKRSATSRRLSSRSIITIVAGE